MTEGVRRTTSKKPESRAWMAEWKKGSDHGLGGRRPDEGGQRDGLDAASGVRPGRKKSVQRAYGTSLDEKGLVQNLRSYMRFFRKLKFLIK